MQNLVLELNPMARTINSRASIFAQGDILAASYGISCMTSDSHRRLNCLGDSIVDADSLPFSAWCPLEDTFAEYASCR